MSEIDDIFAFKGKIQPPQPIASTSTCIPSEKVRKKKKKQNKRKRDVESGDEAEAPHHTHRPTTIVDQSTFIPSPKNPKIDRAPATVRAKVPKPVTHDQLKDSRGVGPRRKTTEGWFVYKEDELGIHDKGGDTPLCPFDCDCCF
ncbi:hypothetical protein BDZ94DRAFT_124477 [Collybia nuda]|uniref:DUF1764-domain-containing protein n=1 Tax=Collybia nuda TaxID=64659 RepID=A0A9P5XWT0_9AGAR|nr:hypothetical protein BDZ94DRAFT_124477 [Collybia nuda]